MEFVEFNRSGRQPLVSIILIDWGFARASTAWTTSIANRFRGSSMS